MKNIQFIDGAENSAYDIFACDDDDFEILFPERDQDIEFIEDVVERIGDDMAGVIVMRISESPVRKTEVQGIHGTLFFSAYQEERVLPAQARIRSRCAQPGIDTWLEYVMALRLLPSSQRSDATLF